MPTYLDNKLDQELDILGSLNQNATRVLTDETSALGAPITGQTGAAANITTVASGIATVTGLTGMTTASVGRFLVISGAASGANNGSFLIVAFTSANSVDIANAAAVAADANNGAITWTERRSYCLEDDLNFTRTDRAAIKGNTFDAPIPTYQRPTAVGTNVPANLTNIAGKTTDAKALVTTRKFPGVTVAATNTSVLITDTGNLKHADAVDRTGVPVQDGADAGNHDATYVEVIDPTDESALTVQAGPDAGKRIFGRTIASGGTSPNSVTVEFRAVATNALISTSVPYTWEAGQPTSVDFYYGFRQRLDLLDETALRQTLINGIVGDAGLAQDVSDIRSTIGIADGAISLAGLLTNTGNFFPFVATDADPSVVEAFNILNAAFGNRDYTSPYLTDGQTITASLQALSDAIAGASITRVIERLVADIPANTAHTLPGGLTYTPDGTFNGATMMVYSRHQLLDPGPVANGNDYAETSSTSVTFYAKQRAGDHLNYMVMS